MLPSLHPDHPPTLQHPTLRSLSPSLSNLEAIWKALKSHLPSGPVKNGCFVGEPNVAQGDLTCDLLWEISVGGLDPTLRSAEESLDTE